MGNIEQLKARVDAFAQNPAMLQGAMAGDSQASNWTAVRADVEAVASKLLAERRRRHQLFDPQMFADPAWDILLVMTIAECRQQRVTVTNLCERIDAPSTTALRWIGTMTDNGLLVRRGDPTDKRRKFLDLSPSALQRMVEYCTSATTPTRLAA